jgi:hypothetical protein
VPEQIGAEGYLVDRKALDDPSQVASFRLAGIDGQYRDFHPTPEQALAGVICTHLCPPNVTRREIVGHKQNAHQSSWVCRYEAFL